MRQILQPNQSNLQSQQLSTSASATRTKQDEARLLRSLRKKRSRQYVEAMKRLDAGGGVANQQQVQELLDAVSDEFEELDMNYGGYMMLGVIAQCFLGPGYEVHTVDFTGRILKHFKRGESLPGGLEKARYLAVRGGYAFVEVYESYACCVSDSGDVSVVQFG